MLSLTKVSRLALTVAALGLSLAPPAVAETVIVTDIVRGVAGENANVTVPSVELTDASIGEDEIREIFAAQDLATIGQTLTGLVAVSVLIPEIRIEGGETTAEGVDERGTIILSNVELTDVAHGIAGGVVVESATFEANNGTSIELGAVAASDLNIGHLFGLFGVASREGADPRDFDSIWSGVTVGATSVATATGSCTLAGLDIGDVFVRALERTTLHDLFQLMDKADKSQEAANAAAGNEGDLEKAKVAAEDAARLQSSYFDVLTSFSAGPMALQGLECDVPNDQGDPMAISIGAVEIGETRPGTLPDMVVAGMAIENTGAEAGTLSLDSMHILPSGYEAVADLFREIGLQVDAAWLKDNQRKLIPSFGGFEISGLVMDLPNSSSPANGPRVVGSIGSLSGLFDNYVNGIPTEVRSSATDATFELPPDESGQMVAMLGLDPLTISYDLAAHWDRARHEIVVENLMLSAGNGGTITISGVLGGVVPHLFSSDQVGVVQASALLTVKELNLDVSDAGLLAKVIAMVAQQQGSEPDQFRGALATMAQGIVLMGLGASPDSIPVAGAISSFLSAGGELSLSAVALTPAGVSISEMQESGGDPTQVLKQFKLSVGETEAEGEEPESAAEEPTPEAAPEAAPPATKGKIK